MNTLTNANDLAKEISKQTEARLIEQLGEFIKRGLIVIEYGPQGFYTDASDPYKLHFEHEVSLKLKDQEYVEKLEKEVAELKDFIRQLLKMQDKLGDEDERQSRE